MVKISIQYFGGRGSSSGRGGVANPNGSSTSLKALGLKVEDEVDESRFNFFNIRYGSYAKQLARDINQFKDDDELLVSYTKGKNIAYAHIDPESDTLIGIISTGGGTGTDLFVKTLQYQQGRGKGLNWMADNKESQKYYDNQLGLKKYGTGNTSRLYDIPASDMTEVIKKLKK